MYVDDPVGELEVGGAVVVRPAVSLVKPHHQVQSLLEARPSIRGKDRLIKLLPRQGELPHPSLQKIARKGRLGQNDHLGP